MAAAIIPAALSAIPLVGKLLGGIGGSSGSNASDNTLRESQLKSAEAAALQGDPQASAELAAWNRPGPTNAEAQQFVAQNPSVMQQAQGTPFSGNYGQVFGNGLGGGTVANPNQSSGVATGGAVGQPASSGTGGSTGSAIAGLAGAAGQAVAGLTAAQNLASQQAQLNASRAAAQNSYAQKAGIRGQALAGLSNSMTAPDLSSDFKSSNPFANQAATPYAGLANTQGAPVLYAGNAQSPGAYSGAPITTPTSPTATSGGSQPGSVPSIGGIASSLGAPAGPAGLGPMAPSATSGQMLPGSVGAMLARNQPGVAV